jgi:hypothetical protein
VGAVVVSVDYRLAPDHSFPVVVKDVVEAVLYLSEHAEELGLDVYNFALSGFSDGGNMAFSVPLRLHAEVQASQKGQDADTNSVYSGSKIHGEVIAGTIKAIVAWYPSVDFTRPRPGREAVPLRPVLMMPITELVRILAEGLKPWRLRALDCVSFYKVEETKPYHKVCFLFKVPQSPISNPVTLQQLIEQGQRPPEKHFYFGHQFTLAAELAAAVYQVLQAGWLHKGIRSSNIQFYKPIEATENWQPDPKDFYLMGYEFTGSTSKISRQHQG